VAKSQKKGGNQADKKSEDPYVAFNFKVEIEGLTVGGFTEVTGLSGNLELESYVEGGVSHCVHHFPTQMSYPKLALIRGLTERDDLWKWYEDATRGKIRLLNGTIILNDTKQSKLLAWNFKKAYPVSWEGPHLHASSGEVIAFEKMELVHRGVYKA
jgi:phage tail-like protein